MTPNYRQAFTLIELAIVLVVIGLVIGGVLSGRDLIQAAQVRVTVSQIEKYESAVHAFRTKYNCLPGDCATATDFGFTEDCSNLSSGCGDGVVEGNFINIGISLYQESLDFWAQLSQARLIDGNYVGYTTYLSDIRANQEVPITKLNNKAMFWVSGEYDGIRARATSPNYFWLGEVVTNAGSNSSIYYGSLTPPQNYAIDSKIDDGLPDTGRVRMSIAFSNAQLSGTGTYGPAGANSDYCATNTTPARYNVQNAKAFFNYGPGVSTMCYLRVLTSF